MCTDPCGGGIPDLRPRTCKGGPARLICLAQLQENTVKSTSGLARIFDAINGAIALAAAHESGRKPARRHVEALGIDPADYNRIGR